MNFIHAHGARTDEVGELRLTKLLRKDLPVPAKGKVIKNGIVIGLYDDYKTAHYNIHKMQLYYFMPHRDPLRSVVGSLALQLHYIFSNDLLRKAGITDEANLADMEKVGSIMVSKRVADAASDPGPSFLGRQHPGES